MRNVLRLRYNESAGGNMTNNTTNTHDKIADYFIGLSNETGSLITNLKLQKLVYYAQAWSLALNNKELFPEDFEAWVHGPVLVKLYNKYRSNKWNPISKNVKLTDAEAIFDAKIK